MIADVKLKIEFGNGGRAVSLDEFIKTFLEAIQRAVRQEPFTDTAAHRVGRNRRRLGLSALASPIRIAPDRMYLSA
jgi:hypothetical protein